MTGAGRAAAPREPAELSAMCALAERLWPSRWHAGELVWFRLVPGGEPPGHRTASWERDGRTVAWAWRRPPARLDLQLDPGHPELAADVLRWFEEGTAGQPRRVTVLAGETALIATLRARGYRECAGEPYFVHLSRGLADLPAAATPAGYRCRAVRGPADAGRRAALHAAAFPPRPGDEPIGPDTYRTLMRDHRYLADLDQLVETEDGTPAAFCLAWLDQTNRAVALEPVGTAPAHRRRGLASVAVLAALHRARELGATTARVCARGDAAAPAARATYESLGFRPFARNLTFQYDG
ncbi:GNAT family N-acetyltransferase [Streptomyces sp. DSM 44915]|uniref:GNAT family N-acetyltransferase n=1 Tax=Streptomyces chisholmiae TaxID=3075540 RepID=A0ABU2K0N2_9ACTN|nr:GNAT family N-acetyltransferase [Streptomyces sp. DSM 44915]MDT0270807.1 GNAT family N-acetyltransferase [Streptomyces sp. DSM 44915]